MSDRPKIAAIVTAFFPNSHADVLVVKFLKGFPTDEGLMEPRTKIASLYVDQLNASGKGIGTAVANANNVPLYENIEDALTLGGDELAVDGVLIIGEHGDYPENELGQKLYPRKMMFEQVAAVIARSGRSIPVFTDKHLSYNTAESIWMYDRARELQLPFMAGSSIPTTWRRPWLELEKGAPIDDAIAIGYGGIEAYTYHTIEALQAMVERRPGGETGVDAVEVLDGDEIWEAGNSGRWNRELFDVAVEQLSTRDQETTPEAASKDPLFIEIQYKDGFRAQVFMLFGYAKGWSFACKSGNETHACEFRCHNPQPYAHFSYLGLNVEEMFVTGKPSYPVERTLLTSCVIDAALCARKAPGKRIDLSSIEVTYEAPDDIPWRARNESPTGACIEPWTYQW